MCYVWLIKLYYYPLLYSYKNKFYFFYEYEKLSIKDMK